MARLADATALRLVWVGLAQQVLVNIYTEETYTLLNGQWFIRFDEEGDSFLVNQVDCATMWCSDLLRQEAFVDTEGRIYISKEGQVQWQG